jgi:hypothetical protein
MGVTLPVIVALLLILPGVGFVVGVNFADKNVREIVFRNTPAEIGYVIVVSLVVHLAFAWFSTTFNAAQIIYGYSGIASDIPNHKAPTPEEVRSFFVGSILYFLSAAFAGFLPGVLFGRAIRYLKLTFFAKHRWMLDLVGVRAGDIVYARVLLSPDFSSDDGKSRRAIVVEGILFDSFFAADGKLLYLVFSDFREQHIALSTPPYVGKFETNLSAKNITKPDRLIIEGQWIEMARYYRVSGRRVRGKSEQEALERAVQEDLGTVAL